jgi:glycosyltransferase involved in cell wall biosynthesis
MCTSYRDAGILVLNIHDEPAALLFLEALSVGTPH